MIHSRSILRSTTALTVLSLAVTAAMASPEAREAFTAFFEKRAPVFPRG